MVPYSVRMSLPDFKPKRTRYESVNYEINKYQEPSIDLHCQKKHTEIHKIPKFGVNQASTSFN